SVAVGGNGFPEGFDEQVIGMETGDVREFELPFEVDHPDETMRGKDAQFRVELHVVNEREIPEVDDAFVAEVSGFDTVKELEDDIHERLLEERKTAARRELEGSALGLLADRSSFEIPEVLVHQQAHALMEDQTRRLTTQGMALDSYLGSIGSSQDEFHDQAMEEAERRIGQALMLDVLADRYGIEVTEEDVEAELAQLLERFPEPDRASMRDMYLGDGGQERMELGLRERKAMESLMDSVVTSSEEPAAPAQPEEADEASEAAEASAETEEDNDQGTG
ncbi:MAG TPA: FKBP-type peptidyl-prolyl cis-trans isomerase, partial [Chloroflexota bacterium]|nr:FKBP-type peptidyl-prolyl cis-trans isomerase [Chloroflexota bacterium]